MDIINSANAAKEKLRQFGENVQRYIVPCQTQPKIDEMTEVMEEFDSCLGNLRDYGEHAQMVAQADSAAGRAQKKLWRSARDGFKSNLMRNSCPLMIARPLSEAFQIEVQDPSSVGLENCSFKEQLSLDDEDHLDISAFATLKLVNESAGDLATHWHKALKTRWETDKVGIIKKVEMVFEHLNGVNPPGNHGWGTIPSTTTFPWNPGAVDGVVQPFFDLGQDVEQYGKHIVCAMRNNRVDISAGAFPFHGVPMFVTCCTGVVAVAIADNTIMQSAGGDFALYAKSPEQESATASMPSFTLKPGESYWLPFGWGACHVGLSIVQEIEDANTEKVPSKKKKVLFETDGCASIMVTLPMNLMDAKSAKPKLNKFLADHFRSVSFWPSSLSKSEGYVKWKASLDAAHAAA